MGTRNHQIVCSLIPTTVSDRPAGRGQPTRLIAVRWVSCLASKLLACALMALISTALATGAGAAPKESVSRLTLALGEQNETPAPVAEMAATYLTTVPEVTGLTLEQAHEKLQHAHLAYQLSGEAAGQQYEDRITRQVPAAGTRTKLNTTVQLTRQPAPTPTAPTSVRVPPIVNLPVPTARSRLQAAGLELAPFDSVSADENAEIVVRQDPTSKSLVPRQSQITIVVRERAAASAPVSGSAIVPPAQASAVTPTLSASASSPSMPASRTNGKSHGIKTHKVVPPPDVVSPSVDDATITNPPSPSSFWREHWQAILSAAAFIAVAGLIAFLRKGFVKTEPGGQWPIPFVVHATLTCMHERHSFHGSLPREACPPASVRLIWSHQPVIRVTFTLESARQRKH
jgi:hypothetical protein